MRIRVHISDYLNAFVIDEEETYQVLKSLGRMECREGGGTRQSPSLACFSREWTSCVLRGSVNKAWGWTVVIFTESYGILSWAIALIDFPTADHEYSQKCRLGLVGNSWSCTQPCEKEQCQTVVPDRQAHVQWCPIQSVCGSSRLLLRLYLLLRIKDVSDPDFALRSQSPSLWLLKSMAPKPAASTSPGRLLKMRGLMTHGSRACILTGAQKVMFHIALEELWLEVVPATLSHVHLPLSYLLHGSTKKI